MGGPARRGVRINIFEQVGGLALEQIEGRHPVLEALAAGRVRRVLLSGSNRKAHAEIEQAARSAGVPTEWISAEELAQRARTRVHQGVLAEAGALREYTIDDLVEGARAKGQAPLLLLSDQVQDPQNIGSLLRSADAAGAHGVVVTARRGAGLGAAAAKASAGAIEHVPIATVVNLVQAIERLKALGVWIAGADADGRETLWEADFSGPLAIVVGNEGAGIRRLVREHCDFLVRIPMYGRVASLNAAVSGAILLFEAARQRALLQNGSV